MMCRITDNDDIIVCRWKATSLASIVEVIVTRLTNVTAHVIRKCSLAVTTATLVSQIGSVVYRCESSLCLHCFDAVGWVAGSHLA